MTSSKFHKNITSGMKSLMLHKLRSFLTMLGVVFGVGSVVAMLSVGEGAGREALAQIERLGSQNIVISSRQPGADQSSNNQGKSYTLEYGLLFSDLERIRESYPAIKEVVPAKIVDDLARVGEISMEVRLVGTTPDWLKLVPRDLLAGRFLIEHDISAFADVCVVSEKVVRKLMPGRDVLGETITISGDAYFVVGVIATDSGAGGGGVQTPDGPLDVYVPLNVARERIGDTVTRMSSGSFSRERVELHKIIVGVGEVEEYIKPESKSAGLMGRNEKSKAIENVEPTAKAIEVGLRQAHDKNDYEISVPLALLRQARETQRIFNIVLGSIAGISLLVGGIGIMNIMLASVTERTREIGVRRAIGAKRRQIIGQFLIETIVLSVAGGLVGVVLGISIPALIEQFADMPTVVTWWSITLSLSISVGVGVVFGLYPAYRAAHLDPIEALRHE